MVSFQKQEQNETDENMENSSSVEGIQRNNENKRDSENPFVLYKVVDNQPVYVDGECFDLSKFIDSIKQTISTIDWKRHPNGAEQSFKVKLQKAFGLSTSDTTPAPNPSLMQDLEELKDLDEKEVLSVSNEAVGDELLFDF